MSGEELRNVERAFLSNWIAPVGPDVDAFEREFAAITGAEYAAALSSGTAALHLALLLLGVGPGDDVFVSTFTFAASVNPIVYLGARPVFIDSELESWNMDAGLLADALARQAAIGMLPKAVMVVHIYGQSADMDAVLATCARYDVPVIEDATEALGASYRGRAPGTMGRCGAFSFNGNKIVTTSGGGMLISDDGDFIRHARKLATQARDAAPHYEHSEIGYNYRLSNILAAIGRGQLAVLDDRIRARRRNFAFYQRGLDGLPGIGFQPEAPWGTHTRWLSCITINPELFGADREQVRLVLEAQNIESRPLWKPVHQQPVFAGAETYGGRVSDQLFDTGLCLPSGSALTDEQLGRVVRAIRAVPATIAQ